MTSPCWCEDDVPTPSETPKPLLLLFLHSLGPCRGRTENSAEVRGEGRRDSKTQKKGGSDKRADDHRFLSRRPLPLSFPPGVY